MFSSMTPAFERFPDDILREIMLYTYVYSLEIHGVEAEFDIEVPSPPIPASHVCRSWRRALLSDPTMWTCLLIPEMSCKWIMELLRRSDSSLLNVFLVLDQHSTYGTSYYETSSTLFALFHQIHRFKVLRVYISVLNRDRRTRYTEVLIQQVVSYLQRPAPKLRTLSFWYEYLDYGRDSGLDTSPDYTVIKWLFSGDAPFLKQIHHRLSCDFIELECPVFHGLSELRLTLVFSLNFGCFLDLLASSPLLKLLYLDVELNDIWPYFEQPSDRKVALSFLEELMLDVNFMVELTDFVLKHVAFPSNVMWCIASRHYPGFEESPSVSRFLSRTHFTSLHVKALPVFSRLTFEVRNTSKNDINSFVYNYEPIEELMDVWNPVMHAFKTSSRITHMVLEVGDLSDIYHIFPMFFASMSSLKSLIIRPSSGADEICLVCLAALIPNLQRLKDVMDSDDTNIENLELDLAPTGLEDITPHDSDPPSSTIPVFPCPLLRKVTVELRDPLDTKNFKILCVCSDLRRNAGYPFQIHVRCPQIEQGVEEILGLRKNKTIKISISPLVEENPHPYNGF